MGLVHKPQQYFSLLMGYVRVVYKCFHLLYVFFIAVYCGILCCGSCVEVADFEQEVS